MDSTAILALIVALAAAAPVLFLIGRKVIRRRRELRALESAKDTAHRHLKAVTGALVSKKLELLANVAGHVAQIHRLAEENGFSLQDIRVSKQRLEQWRYAAAELMANDGKVPVRRLLESLTRIPSVALDPAEPGTPDIEINRPALPGTSSWDGEGWVMRAAGEPLITPVPDMPSSDIHLIELMIEDVMQTVPETGILPERKVVEVLTIDEEGRAHSTFELEGDEPYIEIRLGEEDIEMLSFDEQVDEWFDQIIQE